MEKSARLDWAKSYPISIRPKQQKKMKTYIRMIILGALLFLGTSTQHCSQCRGITPVDPIVKSRIKCFQCECYWVLIRSQGSRRLGSVDANPILPEKRVFALRRPLMVGNIARIYGRHLPHTPGCPGCVRDLRWKRRLAFDKILLKSGGWLNPTEEVHFNSITRFS
jgi:hypothetical protein